MINEEDLRITIVKRCDVSSSSELLKCEYDYINEFIRDNPDLTVCNKAGVCHLPTS